MIIAYFIVFAVLLGLILWAEGYDNTKQHFKHFFETDETNKTLHSKTGYFTIFLFLCSLILIHLSTHYFSHSVPVIIKHLTNSTANPLPYAEQAYTVIFSRYLVLRYAIYPLFLFTYFFDHIKKSSFTFFKWLTPKNITLLLVATFIFVASLSKINYCETPIFQYPVALRLIFLNRYLYVYALLLWLVFLCLSYNQFFKVFNVPHSLWLTSLAFLSLEEVWEYPVYLHTMIQRQLTVTAPIVTMYLWRATPTFLLIFYLWKFKAKLSRIFVFLISMSLSFSLLTVCNPTVVFNVKFNGLSWVLRLTYSFAYLVLVRDLCSSVRKGEVKP